MTEYRNIKGKRVRFATSDLSNADAEGQIFWSDSSSEFKVGVATAAVSSAAPMLTARRTGASFGTQTANVAAGGWVPPFSAKTEEYDGSGWANGEDLPAGVAGQFGAGTLTAGLVYGGYTDSTGQEGIVTTLEYDGTDYSSGGNLSQQRWISGGGAGTQTAALCSSGYNDGNITNTEEYNGSSWTAGEAIDTAKRQYGQCGTQTASILFGGIDPSGTTNSTELYDGTDYSAGPNLNQQRNAIAASGTQTLALGMGGYKDPGYANNIEQYDGTSWSELSANLTTARDGGFGSRGGTAKAALIASGSTPSLTTATEEYNVTSMTITAGAWASGGNMANARRNHGGAGIQTAALAFGGFAGSPPTNLAHSEEYDGSSWSEGSNINTARRGPEGFGTQTAGVANGGFPPPGSVTEEYDGSSWTSVNASNTARLNMFGTAGTLTAGLIFSGSASVNTESYDGTNWTEVANLSTAVGNSSGTGTQTAALCSGGDASGTLQTATEEWNGSAWTSGGALNTAVQQHGTFGPSSNAFSCGGNQPTVTGQVENYNGTSWATGISMTTARDSHACVGATSPAVAGLVGGGFPGSTPAGVNTTEEFTGETTALNLKTITDS